jgi:protein tyrosine phosphatase (PTP) superfamily phosphohydrolase (DUF442 family)
MPSIYNNHQISNMLSCSGQPNEDQLMSIAGKGCRVIINLGLTEGKYALKDEANSVKALGLTYHHIPVKFESPQIDDLAAFIAVMDKHLSEKTLVHCAANYRASCFTGLYLLFKNEMNEEEMTAFIEGIWQPDAVWEDFMEQGLEYIRLKGNT